MKLIASRKEEQNKAAVDPWTAIHFTSGLAMGLIEVPFRHAVAAAVVYEIVEQYAERRGWGKSLFRVSGPESLPNALVDVMVLALGHRLGTMWNDTAEDRKRERDA